MGDETMRDLRRYTRWYPRGWRARNEDALLADLAEVIEAAGRSTPPIGEQIALITVGLREHAHSISPHPRSLFAAVALVCATALAVSPLTLASPLPAAASGLEADYRCLDQLPALVGDAGTPRALRAAWIATAGACGFTLTDLQIATERHRDELRLVTASFGFDPIDAP